MATAETLTMPPAAEGKVKKKTFLVGKFWNPDHTLEALKKMKAEGVRIYDVYSPFPLHGIEPYLDIKRSRLTTAAFIYGLTGFFAGIAMMFFMFGIDWPMNIGGKPSVPWIDFVPITFELTVLFAAHGIVITFFIVAQYWPGKKAKLFDINQTDDVFVVVIDKDELDDEQDVREIMNENGAFEIIEKEEQ